MSIAKKHYENPGQDVLPFFKTLLVCEPENPKAKSIAKKTTPDGLPIGYQVPDHGIDGDSYLRREDGSIVRDKAGKPIMRWGTHQQARKILCTNNRRLLYSLIDAKLVKAYKLNTTARNGRYRVDLQSVMAHKLRQLQ